MAFNSDQINTINNKELLVGYIKKGSTVVNEPAKIKAYLDKNKIAISDTYSDETVHIVQVLQAYKMQ